MASRSYQLVAERREDSMMSKRSDKLHRIISVKRLSHVKRSVAGPDGIVLAKAAGWLVPSPPQSRERRTKAKLVLTAV